MPFCFVWCDRSPTKWSLLSEHQQSNPAHEDWTCYCILVRVTLGEGGHDQPPHSHKWTSSLIADMFQDGLEEWITEAAVLAPMEVILFLDENCSKRGDTKDVGFCLGGPVNWAGRKAQVEMMVSTIQEGCWAIRDAIMERRTKVREPGCPWGTTKKNWTPQQLPKWRWEMAKWVIMRLSGRTLTLNVWVEVEDSVEHKVLHDYQETLPVDLPLQGRESQSEKQTEFPSVNHEERV